jgi:hypothetical protein
MLGLIKCRKSKKRKRQKKKKSKAAHASLRQTEECSKEPGFNVSRFQSFKAG